VTSTWTTSAAHPRRAGRRRLPRPPCLDNHLRDERAVGACRAGQSGGSDAGARRAVAAASPTTSTSSTRRSSWRPRTADGTRSGVTRDPRGILVAVHRQPCPGGLPPWICRTCSHRSARQPAAPIRPSSQARSRTPSRRRAALTVSSTRSARAGLAARWTPGSRPDRTSRSSRRSSARRWVPRTSTSSRRSRGCRSEALLPLLATFLPMIIDMLTPDGNAPRPAPTAAWARSATCSEACWPGR
jgi:hypothetical protein